MLIRQTVVSDEGDVQRRDADSDWYVTTAVGVESGGEERVVEPDWLFHR